MMVHCCWVIGTNVPIILVWLPNGSGRFIMQVLLHLGANDVGLKRRHTWQPLQLCPASWFCHVAASMLFGAWWSWHCYHVLAHFVHTMHLPYKELLKVDKFAWGFTTMLKWSSDDITTVYWDAFWWMIFVTVGTKCFENFITFVAVSEQSLGNGTDQWADLPRLMEISHKVALLCPWLWMCKPSPKITQSPLNYKLIKK